MSSAACQVASSLAALPRTEVVRVLGASPQQLAASLDPLPPDAPVVVRCDIPVAPTASAVVAALLDRLEVAAAQVFLSWLPDGDAVSTKTSLDRRVVRMLARRYAAQSQHFGPFLADVAEAVLLGRPRIERFSPDVRARGLARILAAAYDRDDVVLLIDGPDGLDTHEQHIVAGAFSWLADHGIGIWIAEGVLSSADRFQTRLFTVPASPLPIARSEPAALIDIPAPLGRPHPLSVAEQRLAHALDQCEWARGRHWNQVWNTNSLRPAIRVDLIWPDEHCVVEIDGADHRTAEKYAADRVRDNALALEGYRVLRFTNEHIASDMASVLDVIRDMLDKLRHEQGRSS